MSFEDIGYTVFYQKHFHWQITLAINFEIKFSCFKKKIWNCDNWSINNQNEDNNYCQIYIALLSHIIYSFDIIKSIIKSKEPQSFLQFSKHPGQKIG